MKLFQHVFEAQENEQKIKLFNSKFLIKYKNKCKIIYKNKLYPLQDEFDFIYNPYEKIKVKLVTFYRIPHSEKEYVNKKNESKKYKKNYNKYIEYLKYSLNEFSIISYYLPTTIKKNKNFWV